jgi:hypothetical protein
MPFVIDDILIAAGVAAVGAGVSGGIAAATAGGGSKNSAGKNYRKLTAAQLAYAQPILDAHKRLDPQYQALDEQLLLQRLFGDGQSQGMLNIYEQQIQPQVSRINNAETRDRVAGEIATINELGKAARDARDASNPEVAALLRRLTADANTGLDAGVNLTPDQANQIAQANRRAAAARGVAASPAAAFREALATSQAGQALQASRRDMAGQVIGINQSYYGDPWQQFLGRGGSAPGGAAFLGLGSTGTRMGMTDATNAGAQLDATQMNNAQQNQMFWQNQAVNAAGAGIGGIGEWLANQQKKRAGTLPAAFGNG